MSDPIGMLREDGKLNTGVRDPNIHIGLKSVTHMNTRQKFYESLHYGVSDRLP